MKFTPFSIVGIAIIQSACHGQQPSAWNFVVNAEGATILTANSLADTPSGPHPCVLVLTKSKGGPNAYFSIDFKVAGISRINDFHFVDFEGPDARINKKLMCLDLINQNGEHENYSFLPNGAFVSDPADGFMFGTMEKGLKNQLGNILLHASTLRGRLIITVYDSINSNHTLKASFNIDEGNAKFHQFLGSK